VVERPADSRSSREDQGGGGIDRRQQVKSNSCENVTTRLTGIWGISRSLSYTGEHTFCLLYLPTLQVPPLRCDIGGVMPLGGIRGLSGEARVASEAESQRRSAPCRGGRGRGATKS